MAVERLFPHFCEFFFPEIHALIDWKQRYKFLAQELAQISAGVESELNKPARTYRRGQHAPLRVDLLVEVYFNDGRTGRILLHLEIQNERDPFFDERLFIYHYRIFDKTRDPVITLALLTDFEPAWRPGQYVRELAGCRVEFNFPIRKFTDYNEQELTASRNPFAFIARAQNWFLSNRLGRKKLWFFIRMQSVLGNAEASKKGRLKPKRRTCCGCWRCVSRKCPSASSLPWRG